MARDGLTVVRPDLNVDGYHAASSQDFQQTCIKHARAAMRHAGLDDHLWLDLDDQLLNPNQVFRQLNYRASHPGEVVRVFRRPTCLYPQPGNSAESFGAVKR